MKTERTYRRKLKVENDQPSAIEQQVNELSEQIMQNLRRNLPESSGVYKIFYGDKYLVVKGKTISGSLFLLVKGYGYFLYGGQGSGNKAEEIGNGRKLTVGVNEHYWKFYSYVKTHPKLEWRLEIILRSDSGYRLLRAEQEALDAGVKDKNMLNSNVQAYIPKLREANKEKHTLAMYGWLTPQAVTRFLNWQNRLHAKK